jgi:hypothetical protein
MKKNTRDKHVSESMKESAAARRKAEMAAGIRTDRRFVEKIVSDKRRKKNKKQLEREMRHSPDRETGRDFFGKSDKVVQ